MKSSRSLAALLGTALASDQLLVQDPNLFNVGVDETCSFNHYAAMGDSYSVGLKSVRGENLPVCDGTNGGDSGPYCTTESCAKNYGAYAWQFYQKYQPTYFDWFACSGANSTQCVQDQVPLLNVSTDLITITVGGDNGAAFAGIVKNCMYDSVLKHIKPRLNCTQALDNATHTLSTVQTFLNDTLTAINKKAPNAKIMLMSYAQLWGNTTNCRAPLKLVSETKRTLINSFVLQYNGNASHAIDVWNSANSNTQDFVNATFVNVDRQFDTYRLCDKNLPYFESVLLLNLSSSTGNDDHLGSTVSNADVWPKTGVCHPNYCGQRAYLDALTGELGCTLRSNFLSGIHNGAVIPQGQEVKVE